MKTIICILFHKKYWVFSNRKYWSFAKEEFDCCDDYECSKCGRKWIK